MKPIRRKKKPTPAQQALDYAKLAVRGLVAVRVARSAFSTYKLARKLPFVLGGLALGGVVIKLLRGRGKDSSEAQWTPPSTAQEPSSPSVPSGTANGAPKAAAPADTAGTGSTPPAPPSPPVETSATGSSPASIEPEAPTAPPVDVADDPATAAPAGATDDGPELKPGGGDIAPELDSDEK